MEPDSSRSATPATDPRPVKSSGYAGLLGFSNSGKSSILNNVTGRSISAVTGQPFTTRTNVAGLTTSAGWQVCFIDTPDISRVLDHPVMTWLDVYCLVMDSRRIDEQMDSMEVSRLFELSRAGALPVILVLTFVDYFPDSLKPALLHQAALRRDFAGLLSCCPAQGGGGEKLLELVVGQLPRREALFPDDCRTPHSERFLVGEQIRTQLYRVLPPDVASSTAVQIEEFSFRDGKTYVRANIHVARHSSKGMVIGRKGATLQRISDLASEASRALLGKSLYLDLWVKVREGWPDSEGDLLEFGYVC
ncbi:50S ribosome-binding GTPase [Candidatus Fermentibacterales bacterium]|nr:50S ribosome-binding GTPase [Candidatus Fermentibacterales bacterium]